MKQEKQNLFVKLHNNKCLQYILAAIIVLFFISSYAGIYDVKPDLNGDNIHYFSLGKALSEGKGFTDIMSFEETPHTHFPPGYPVFVAGVMKFFSNSINAVKMANGVLLGISLLLLFFLLKKLSGDLLLSFITCMLCSLHADLLRWSTIMMSEILFLLCTLSAIYLMLQIDIKTIFSKKGRLDHLMLLALIFFMNYIYFVRTMGTSLILALIIYSGLLFIRQVYVFLKVRKSSQEQPYSSEIKRNVLKYGLLTFILAFSFIGTKTVWDIRNRNVGKMTNDYIGDFKKSTNGQVMTTWQDWSKRVEKNFNSYLSKWIPNSIFYTSFDLNKKTTSGEMFRGICIAILLILGLIRLREGSLLLFLYLGATMAVLLIWPEQYGGMRYFITIVPFFIFLFLNGLKVFFGMIANVFKQKSSPIWQTVGVGVFTLIFMFPSYTKAIEQPRQMAKYKTWNAQLAGNAFAEYLSAVKWCAANLPDTARIVCRKTEIFYLYSGSRKSIGFLQYGKPEDVYNQLVKNNATHVIIDHWFRHAYVTLYPLITTYYPEKFKLVCKFDGPNPKEDTPTQIFEFNPEWGYHGELIDGKKEGKGKLVLQDGRTYIGNFENDRINGYGELSDQNGNIVAKGIWKDDILIKVQ